jgi:fructose-specific component phosphotransferase system IIB-like protein
MTGIVWLASYPKSGNTWLRVFLAHLVDDGSAPLTINTISRDLYDGIGIASDRHAFDQFSGLDASDLLPDEIETLRPRVYEAAAAQATRQMFVKVHDANLPTVMGEPLISPAATRAAVYIVRNPLDVAVSLAFHSAVDYDIAIARMADPDFCFSDGAGGLPIQLRQRLSSWSGHAASWLDAAGLACQVMRYEDMVARPFETFSRAVRFLDLPADDARIADALEAARFERLRAEEERVGFVERPSKAERFFREGRVGGWRRHLTEAQARRIVADHGAMMRRLDYIDCDGNARY